MVQAAGVFERLQQFKLQSCLAAYGCTAVILHLTNVTFHCHFCRAITSAAVRTPAAEDETSGQTWPTKRADCCLKTSIAASRLFWRLNSVLCVSLGSLYPAAILVLCLLAVALVLGLQAKQRVDGDGRKGASLSIACHCKSAAEYQPVMLLCAS